MAALLIPLVTPVAANGAVVEQDVRRLMEYVGPQVTAFLPALSSGEGWRLSSAQWYDMISATRRYADGLPVYAGVELGTTAAVVERSSLASELGVDGIVATTPFSPVLDPESAVGHFQAILSHARLPLLIYNESALSGNECDVATLARCCALPGVVGVKESSGVPAMASELMRAVDGIAVYQGWEHLIGQPAGLAGCAVGLANIEPGWCREAASHPTPLARLRVNEACAQYRLFADDWYRHLKAELVRRGILSSSCLVGSPEEGKCQRR